ncbi:MAG: ROK family transcriptional regulator [Rhizobiales bacterium]|nr:ROK family transcriptional regulator [Hyphomicrobiales bacterium]MBI3673461.1 ROK family transcriptional regulator [Hyphomicrobiales bacterium]
MSEKADSELVRRQNRRVVLETLRHAGPMARIELGRRTGLSPATISSIAGQLIDRGLVQPIDEAPASEMPQKRGRPITRLDLNPAAAHVLAVKLSIDELELVLADFRGEVGRRIVLRIPTYEADAARFGATVAQEIRSFLQAAKVPARAVARIGVAVQGLADTHLGTVVWSPAFGARNVPIGGPIEQALGLPVSVANDANMMAEGLLSLDPQRYGGTTAVVFMGYGVGMGLVIDGHVYHGPTGGAAEFGHMNHIPRGPLCRCGRQGCIEAYAADYGIVRAASEMAGSARPSETAVPEEIMLGLEEAARHGEPRARAAFEKAGEALGFGIARLIALLSPSRVVLAGPGTRAMALIEPALHRSIADGVVDELRRNVAIEVVPLSTDMIVKGTIDGLLRHLDRDVLAAGDNRQPLETLG